MDTDNTRTSVFGRVSLRLVVATVFLSCALFIMGVALFVTQTTVAQNSLPTISFSEITPVREGETAVIMVSISEPLPTSLPLTLTLVREGSTATRNEDYILTPGGVKINAGETSAEIAVPTIFDFESSYYEGDETVVLELRVNENKVEFATPKQRTLTITDALPAPTLELDDKVLRRGGVRVDYIEEGDQTSSVVVDVNGTALDYDLPVSLNVVGGTVDPNRITIEIFDDEGIGRRSNGGIIAQVSVVNNNRYEGEQTVIFELSAPGSGLEITTARREFTIRDDELPPTLSFDPIGEFGEIKEGEEFTATVRLDTALSVPVFVTLMSEQGGTAGMDELEWNPESVEIPAGKRTAEFTLRPVDDEIDERGEGFVLRPSASIPDPGVSGGVRALDSTPFMVVIVDDDPPPGVSLSGVTYVKEGKSRVITAELDRASDETITVTLTADPSSTADEQDYTPRLPLSRTIAPGDLTTEFIFSSIDDGLYEGAEDELLVLRTSARGDRGELTGLSGGVLPIRDGQLPPTVSFNPIPDFSEGEQREVEVRLSGRMDEPLTLDLIPAGSAVYLRDYTLSEQSITIPAGSLTESVTLSAADVDGNKLIQLSLSTTNEQVDLSTADFAVTILDDGGVSVPTVSLDPITGINEGDSGQLTVRLNEAATEQLVISLRTAPGGSAESTDYVEPTGNIVIAAGQLSANFQFNTTEDQVYEGDETLILELEVVEGNVNLGTVRRTLTIVEDDDVPNLEIEAAIGIDEGTSREVTIGLTGALEDTVTVSLNMIGLSDRIDSTDYSMLPSALTIVPGALGVTFTIVTTSDMVYEGDEIFDLELLAIAPTIILGAAVTRITIREDELLPTLMLEEVGPIGEGQSRIVIVNLSGPLDIPVMISLDNVPGGSANDAEVSLSPPRMEIPAGEQSARFLVAISSDIVYELTETVLLRPIGRDLFDNDLSFTTTVSTVLIRDDDPLPSLSLDPVVDIPEGFDRTVQVRLSGPLDIVTNVSLIITPDLGSGINPLMDYQIQERTVAIPPGKLEANFVLETNDNSVWQNDKILTISFDLIDDHFGLQRGVTSREVVIVEDERVPVLIWDAIAPIVEGDTRVVTARLDAALGFPLAVTLVATDISAISPDDYAIATATVTIPAGSLTADFEVVTVVDLLSEELETFELRLQVPPDTVELGVDVARVVSILDGTHLANFARSKEVVLEGQELEVELETMGILGYDLTIDIADSTAGFDFAQDITSVTFARAQEDRVFGAEEIVTAFPQTFQIMTSTRLIRLTFEVANDTEVERGESFTLEATSANSYVRITRNMVEVEVNDYVATADLSVIGPTDIAEGETVTIGIELDRPLIQFLADNLAVDTAYEENVFASSGFEDISSATGVREFSIVSNSEAYTETLGFGFRFYGETYNTIAVHTNGFIGFTDDPDDLLNGTDDPEGYRGGNTPAIDGEVVPIVAPLLSPINYRNPDGLEPAPSFYGVRLGAGTADDRYIVQYTNARVRVDVGVRALATFQVVLYANGRIELRYQDIPSEVQKVSKIGISNGTETEMFEEYSYLESRLSESDTRIVYTPASRVNAVIKDADGEIVTDFGILDIIAVNEVRGTIQLVNRNREDTNWDGDQTYTVELVSDSPLINLIGTVATYRFTDDELPEVILEYVCTTVCDRAEVAEGDSLSLIARLTNAPEGAAEIVTVNLEIQGGTATETLDYTLPASITIAEGTTQTIFAFSPTDDNLAEYTEDVTIGFSSIEYGDNEIQSDVGLELFITDNDPRPPISLDPVAPIVEGQTRVVTARLDAALGFPLAVTLVATDISAISPDDYAIATATMTIPAGSVTADFEVVTLVDQLSEELETFELSLQVPPETVGLDVDATRVVTILEGTHLVNFARSEEVVLEGQEFEVRLDSTGILGYDLTIDIADSTAGFDFAQDISSVKFAQGDAVLGPQETVPSFPRTFQIMGDTRLIVLTFEVTNDREIEADELFTLEATSSESYVTIDSNTVEVTLSDYIVAVDVSVIGPVDIAEGEAVTIGIELDRPLTQFLTDNLGMGGFYDVETIVGSNFEDISSIAGDPFPAFPNNAAYLRALGFDFQFYTETYNNIAVHTNGFIGFTDDANDLQIPRVNVFSDNFKGDDTPASGDDITLPIVAPLLSAIDPRRHANIAANDLPSFYGVRLGAGTAEDRYIVQYTNARVAIAPGGSRVAATFQVALYADGRIEFRYQTIPDAAQEAAKIGISNGTGTGMYEEFSYRESLLSDDTRIVYTRPSVDIVIKEADDEAVTSFDIFDIIAVDGVSGTIQLVNRNRADTNWDGDQTYTAELVSTSPLIVSTGTVAPYRFTDDDLPEVTLEYDMCTTVCDMAEVAEGASLTLIVKLTNAPEGAAEAVTVNLEIQGGTATEDSDYTLPTSVTIAEGAAQTILVFSPTDDNLAERAEDLIIGISSVEYGGNQIPSSASFELSITDNDERPTISLDPVAPITEGDTRVVTARLLGAALGFPLEVTLIATDTSASSPTDYDITVPTVTIPAGSLTVDFEIVTVADMSREETEEFELSLQVPPETVGLDVDATRVVTILDGTPLVGFSRSEDTVIEGQELRVQLDSTGSYDYDLTIDIADSTAGFDFAQDITSVTFAQGEGVLGSQEIVTSFPQTFQIMSSTRLIQLTFEVANDTEVEGDESFTLEATSATSDVRITRNIVEVDVIDYVVTADLSVIGPTDIAEGEAVTIGIELDRPLTQFLADNLAIDTAYEENVFAGSNFEDISSATGVHNFSVDDANGVELRELGFGFQFYTETYNTIVVHTNGVIGFTDDANDILIEGVNVFSDGYRGDKTPANGEGTVLPIVAPLLSSINYFDPGNLDPVPAFYGARLGAGTDKDRYIVQYTNARARVAAGVRVPSTFQVALYANGRIEFRYQDIPSEVQKVAKIGISNGEGTNMYEEFSYTESRLSESDTRIVYTPSSRVNAVIKDAAGETVTEFGILDIIAVDEISGTIQLVNPDREDAYWLGDQTYTAELVSTSPLVVSTGTVATYRFTDANLPEVIFGI